MNLRKKASTKDRCLEESAGHRKKGREYDLYTRIFNIVKGQSRGIGSF